MQTIEEKALASMRHALKTKKDKVDKIHLKKAFHEYEKLNHKITKIIDINDKQGSKLKKN